MEPKEEKKELKIGLWTFYVLVASVIVLLAATVSGWLLVVRQNIAEDMRDRNNIKNQIVIEQQK